MLPKDALWQPKTPQCGPISAVPSPTVHVPGKRRVVALIQLYTNTRDFIQRRPAESASTSSRVVLFLRGPAKARRVHTAASISDVERTMSNADDALRDADAWHVCYNAAGSRMETRSWWAFARSFPPLRRAGSQCRSASNQAVEWSA